MKAGRLAIAATLALLAQGVIAAHGDDKQSDPTATKGQTYSFNLNFSGSLIPTPTVTNLQVPADMTYAQMTPAEKRRIKNYYFAGMPENDEPPYPLRGLEPILRVCGMLEHFLLVDGVMSVAVVVDAHGQATSVEVFQSPDKKMTRAMARVLMREKYKPAVCNGSPCQMHFPFRMKFVAQPYGQFYVGTML